MRTASLTSAFGILSLALLAGCTSETLESDLIKTKGIAATIEVTASNDGASTVLATLRAGGDESNTYIELQNGDELTASADGSERGMSRVDEGQYEAGFDTGAGGVEFVVDFQRADDTSAPNSRGIMPEPFSVTAEDGKRRAEEAVVIEWGTGSNGDMNIVVEGDCIFQFDEDVPDTGTYTIQAGELDSTGGDEPEACELTAVLTRTAHGTADPAFDGESSVALRQVRSDKFSSEP
jgi:hypothetical protein